MIKVYGSLFKVAFRFKTQLGFHKISKFLKSLVEVFYNVKNGSSFITSKSSSKNLSNEDIHWCFCCLQDQMLIEMPILWNHSVFVFIAEIL